MAKPVQTHECPAFYIRVRITPVYIRTSIDRLGIPRSRHPLDPSYSSLRIPLLESGATRAGADVSTRVMRLFLDGRV